MVTYYPMTPVSGSPGESNLSLTYTDLLNSVGSLCGFGSDYTAFDASQLAEVDLYVQAGYRLFLSPPMLRGDKKQHRWSFLSPITTIDTIEEYSTGTVTVVLSDKTVVLGGGGTWPAWAAGATIIITDALPATHEFTVDTRTDGANIELTEAWDHAGAAGLSYVIHYHPETYDLPATFGGIKGSLTYDSNGVVNYVPVVGEEQLRVRRNSPAYDTGYPRLAAVRWKAATGTTGQRAELLLYPAPDAVYTLSYMYDALVSKLSTGAPYPLGGMMFSATIEQACRSVAELRRAGKLGVETDLWLEMLAGSVARDRQVNVPQFLGYNFGDGERCGEYITRHGGFGALYYESTQMM